MTKFIKVMPSYAQFPTHSDDLYKWPILASQKLWITLQRKHNDHLKQMLDKPSRQSILKFPMIKS